LPIAYCRLKCSESKVPHPPIGIWQSAIGDPLRYNPPMSRSWQYPRWRRMLMQATLVLILGGTVALAEFITRQRNRSSVPELEQSQKIDRVLVKLPAGWEVSEDDPNVLLAQEPGPDGQGRTLMVRLLHATNAKSAAEFLRDSGLLNGAVVIHKPDQDDPNNPDSSITMQATPVKMQPITVAGQPGVIARVPRMGISLQDMSAVAHNQLIAAAILPSKTAIVVQLDSTEPDVDGDDERLMKRIAAAMQLQGETKP
jgi:hypothetical protein